MLCVCLGLGGPATAGHSHRRFSCGTVCYRSAAPGTLSPFHRKVLSGLLLRGSNIHTKYLCGGLPSRRVASRRGDPRPVKTSIVIQPGRPHRMAEGLWGPDSHLYFRRGRWGCQAGRISTTGRGGGKEGGQSTKSQLVGHGLSRGLKEQPGSPGLILDRGQVGCLSRRGHRLRYFSARYPWCERSRPEVQVP